VWLTAAGRVVAAVAADAVPAAQARLEQFGDERLDQADGGPEHLVHAGRRLLVVHADGRPPRAHGEVDEPGGPGRRCGHRELVRR